MYRIANKQIINQDIKRLDIAAPDIAARCRPGQFVMVMPHERAERIPLTVVEVDERRGYISLIILENGPTTKYLGAMQINDEVYLLMGPLGRPATIVERKGLVVCIATGLGATQILPVSRALKKSGNKVIGIIGAKTKKALMLVSQLRVVCDEIYITTNDGTYERKGLATEILRRFMERQDVRHVYAAGSVEMMEAVTQMTAQKNIDTFVYLNPLMLDGLGVCGSCRVEVGGVMKLACLDGPEFNGHEVNYEYARIRMDALKELDEWGNLKSRFNQKKEEPPIFKKLLSGILRSRP